jgi:predicted secreted protein
MAKYSAFGTTLKRGGTGGTAIANISKISGPGLSVDTEDVTSHDSTSGWEEHVATILRSGEVTLDIVYDPNHATHKYAANGLLHDMVSRAAVTYAIGFPSTAAVNWVFSAFVIGFEPDMPHDGALTASVTLKLTGAPTLA